MPSYCCPVADLVPPIYVHPDRHYPAPALAHKLFRHYKLRARGRNIYILTDNTVTRDPPADATTIRVTVHGGHTEELASSDITLLTNAGYPSSC